MSIYNFSRDRETEKQFSTVTAASQHTQWKEIR